ncbi:MAG TPA: twin-arginine translocase TatA/TatE family subunit [Candidatus Limnocylindrales bacterium]|nr:twin-arginine translocase TatA/TatE family subunit [Candidatus Limnocylindrales bacterium]
MPFIPNIGPGELILILIIALVVLGPGKLPDVAQSLGKSLREFRKAASDVQDAARVDAPAPSTSPASAPPASPAPSAPPASPTDATQPASAEVPAIAPNTLSSATEPNTLQAPDPGANDSQP